MKLFDLLRIPAPDLTPASSKVHLATWNGREHPVDVYRRGEFEPWLAWQSRQYFNRSYVVALVQLVDRTDRWLLTGAYRPLSCMRREEPKAHWYYEFEEVAEVRALAGRVVVHHRRSGRVSTRKAEAIAEDLDVVEVREQPYQVDSFRTYSDVRLMKSELDLIVRVDDASWRSALSAVAGVYLITDTASGKLYVGSATGDTSAPGGGGLWNRWCQYVATGHGGNHELVQLLSDNPAYTQNFQFSILEIADTHASSEDVKRRERHWKQVLRSHVFGYNANV